MKQPYFIAPSILSADFAQLGSECARVLAAGADMIHFDVMDNHFVPNLTVGPMVCSAIRHYGITAPIDVHLMINPLDHMIPEFANAGATYISIHPESTTNVHDALQSIKDQGCKSGIVFNPDTPLDILPGLLKVVDLVLIMSVHPGFAGQAFIPASLAKITQARGIINTQKRKIRLEVDGGVKLDNIYACADAGADTFVAGSAIFNSRHSEKVIQAMRQELKKAKP